MTFNRMQHPALSPRTIHGVQSGGFEARAADDEALAAAVRRHASEAHGMALSHEEALLLAFRVELDDKAPRAIARKGGEAAEGLVDRTAEALAVELLHALEVLDPERDGGLAWLHR